ncbi:MAG: hypothetical protein KatS3mg103_0900 [Phycisphaerales bacterium]|nr:MAG: hypothetical protein KatS3mg103_0900 [Phycisphaerales bacterium]
MTRGFTLAELLVTLVVVALVMGLAVPRVVTMGGRRLEAQAQAVADLLSSAAGRSAIGAEPLRLRVQEGLVAVDRRWAEQIGQSERWTWRADPFFPAVGLKGAAVLAVRSQGRAVAGPPWVVGSLRSGVELELAADPDRSQRVVVALPAGALRAVVLAGQDAAAAPGRVDLDASGTGEHAMVVAPEARARGFLLVDVIVGVVLLGIALGGVLAVSTRALSMQRRATDLQQAAMVADEVMATVHAYGTEGYTQVLPAKGRGGEPFDRFGYEVRVRSQGSGQADLVSVQVTWQSPSGQPRWFTLEALIAPRLGEQPEPNRQPPEPIER